MARMGVFKAIMGLAGADVGTLALKPGVVNPLAESLQTVLNNAGYDKLSVDGNWGDCSESAYVDFLGETTSQSPETVDSMLGLRELGIDPSNVQFWGKRKQDLWCKTGADQWNPDAAKPNPEPGFVILGRKLGMTPNQACERMMGPGAKFTGSGCEAKAGGMPVLKKYSPTAVLQRQGMPVLTQAKAMPRPSADMLTSPPIVSGANTSDAVRRLAAARSTVGRPSAQQIQQQSGSNWVPWGVGIALVVALGGYVYARSRG